MEQLTIAFLYNIFKSELDLSSPESFIEADFDSPETIKAIIKHLKKLGHKVIPIEADKNAYLKLKKNKDCIDLAFNYGEGIHGKDRECHIPAMLEMLQIPYVGCSPLTQAIIFNKVKTNEILRANKIPVSAFQVFKTGDEKLSKNLKFPLLVKPSAQGQSAGITKNSLVHDEKQLYKQVKLILKTFKEDVLVEQFLPGREFSVGIIGDPPEILPFVELTYANLPAEFPNYSSVEIKFCEDMEKTKNFLTCPAKIDKALENKIKKICLNTWKTLSIKDWCRIDLRCDEKGNPHVLEVNSPASLEPPETVCGYCSFTLASETHGLSFPNLLQKIINTSRKHHGI